MVTSHLLPGHLPPVTYHQYCCLLQWLGLDVELGLGLDVELGLGLDVELGLGLECLGGVCDQGVSTQGLSMLKPFSFLALICVV